MDRELGVTYDDGRMETGACGRFVAFGRLYGSSYRQIVICLYANSKLKIQNLKLKFAHPHTPPNNSSCQDLSSSHLPSNASRA